MYAILVYCVELPRWSLCFLLSFLNKNMEPVQVYSTQHLRDQHSKFKQDGCKIYIDSYMALSGSCFIIIFKDPPFGGRLQTEPWDLGIPKSYNHWLIILSLVRTPYEYKFIVTTFGWGPGNLWLHSTLEGPWVHYMILEVSWDNLWIFYWAPMHSWWWLLAHVWSGPKPAWKNPWVVKGK